MGKFVKLREEGLVDVKLGLKVDDTLCRERVISRYTSLHFTRRKVLGGKSAEEAEEHYARVDKPNQVQINQQLDFGTRHYLSLFSRRGPCNESPGAYRITVNLKG